MAQHRRHLPYPGLSQAARVTVLSAAAATAAAALGAAPATAEPGDTPERARARVDRLFEQAERATEAFNKADERADRLRGQVERAQDALARGQERLNRMRDDLGALAGAQYRDGGIDPTLALMLSADPAGYLDKASALDRLNARQAGRLADFQEIQRTLGQERSEATRTLADLQRSRAAVARHKRTVEARLTEARRLLEAMPDAERAAFDRSSRSARADLPAMTGSAVPSSGRAAAAVAAARQAVGRPYVWGANGPSGFDCSGLVQWSYGQAGVGLPRTSQAQRHAGRQVPLAQAQPGDIVTYRDDASHVGLYMGNGQVVHAPYPGAPVRYDLVGMMPVGAVTRP
ncbi:NlpC/P60 family protein [Streptomyces sp. NPDC060194]|uniref:C40 family peptidase n=1 Tax=Streptomyces sp. NPDC060194 TaxID=3347069 RepID=UPI00364B0B44